jgi:hypothetical protein
MVRLQTLLRDALTGQSRTPENCLDTGRHAGAGFAGRGGEDAGRLGLERRRQPSLDLADKDGNLRASVGSTKLETVKTAGVTIRSGSSLVLFDKDGKVIWKAPKRQNGVHFAHGRPWSDSLGWGDSRPPGTKEPEAEAPAPADVLATPRLALPRLVARSSAAGSVARQAVRQIRFGICRLPGHG